MERKVAKVKETENMSKWVVEEVYSKRNKVIESVKLFDTDTNETRRMSGREALELIRKGQLEVENLGIHKMKLKMKVSADLDKVDGYFVKESLSRVVREFIIKLGEDEVTTQFKFVASVFGEQEVRYGLATRYEISKLLGVDKREVVFYNETPFEESEETKKMVSIRKELGKAVLMDVRETEDGLIEVESLEGDRKARVVIPDEVNSIKSVNGGINELVLGRKVSIIESYCCEDAEDLFVLDARNSSEELEIGEYAFQNSSLESIKLPKKVKEVQERAFSQSMLKGSLTGCIEEVGPMAFEETNLKEVNLSEVKRINVGAFRYNLKLKKVTLGYGLESIDSRAFQGCEKLEKVSIPSTCKLIGVGAFEGCRRLKEIIIPEGCTMLGKVPRGLTVVQA